MYDAATACAEAILMAVRISKKNKVLVSNSLNPEYIDVIKTYTYSNDIEVDWFDKLPENTGEYAGVLIQNPDFYGEIKEIKALDTLLIVCTDISSLSVLKPPVEADIVVGVPESGNPAALGFSMESGIPYGNAFIKNNYVGRTFIKPKQEQRESSVKVKLNVLKEAVAGKRVVMIDDSIVRGTTSARIVNLLKAAGAKEVHVRISSPAFLHPCYFGTDIPSEDQLIASGHSVDEICEIIGADSLGYLEVDKLSEMICGQTGYCDACFTGNYPIEPPKIDIRGEMG